jgi:cupin fold WbuC family metalloprotein
VVWNAVKWPIVTRAGVQLIDEALIEATLAKARLSPRLRANHNFHASHADGFHRFLNAWIRGTYVAPHRHVAVPKPEAFMLLRGELVCFVFDDDGRVLERVVLGRDGRHGIDLAAGIWHTLAPLTAEAVCYEVKPGPWDAATDKEFAPWAPREGEPGTATYLAALLTGLT